jgi:hypothetical protein
MPPVQLESVLATNALVSLEEVKAHLSIVRPTNEANLVDEDQRLVDAINWVSAFVESAVRPMARKTETVRRSRPPSSPLLSMLRVPIDLTDPITCTLADTVQTIWTQESDGARGGFDVLVYASVPGSPWCPDGLWRRAGWGVGHGRACGCGCGGPGAGGDPQPILLTYTGGFDCLPATGPNQLPGDMRVAVLDTVRAWHRNQQQGTADVVAIAQPGGGPTFEMPRWIPYGARQTFLSHQPVVLVP